MCKVIRRFRDLQDNGYIYEVGDKFPHSGVKVSDKRYEELAGSDNNIGVPLISGKPRKATGETRSEKKDESPTSAPRAKGKAKKRSKNHDDVGADT